MKLPRADWQMRPAMERLLDALGADAGDTRYVGGCVRDSLLGLPVSDIDLATRLSPETVMDRLQQAGIRAIPTGIAHGTITALVDDMPVEVTTLRRDVSTDGRRATIAYTDDWKEDAARRDFTINALSADPTSLVVHDYFGGEEDLRARRLRFIGDPLVRIAEDHLRILRFFRFHARFGEGAPDPEALAACIARANDLMALSRERIADELLKLLGLPNPAPTVELMVENGILRPVLPEVTQAGVAALRRLVEREAAANMGAAALRRLAALLPADPGLAGQIAYRLRLSKKATKQLVSVAERQDSDGDAPLSLAYLCGADVAVDRLLLASGDPDRIAGQMAMLRGWERPHLRVTGGDLIAMGLKAGPIVARTLRTVEQAWMDAGFPDDAETVRALAREKVDQALRDSQ